MSFKPKRLFQSLPQSWRELDAWAGFWAAVWLILLIGAAVWLRLGSTGLLDETEPLFAEAARQMQITGDWVTPYFNETTRFDKPPLIYWLMALCYEVLGVNEWAARFPSALSATLLTLFGFWTLRRFGWPRPEATSLSASLSTDLSLRRSAWIGSAMMVLNLQTIAWGRIGVSDLLLSGCMSSALLAFFWGYALPDRAQAGRWYWAVYGLSGLAVLTKGPVGALLPGLIILAFLLYTGNLGLLREMKLLGGSLLFLLITLPWYVLVIWANGEAYIQSFFGYHNLERFTRVVNSHWAPPWFYLAVMPIAFLPWSVYLPVAIARLRFWRLRDWRAQPRSTHLGIFALIWFGVVFGFFTLAATKLPSYMIPLLPAAAILVGLFWSDQYLSPYLSPSANRPANQPINRAVSISHWVNIGLAVALAVTVWLSPSLIAQEPEMPELAALVRQSGIAVWGSVIWLVVAGAELVLLRRHSRWIWSIQLAGWLAFLLITLLPLITIIDAQRQLPLRRLAQTIVQIQQPGEPVLMIGYRKPSLVFYTQRPITYIAALSDVPEQLQKLERKLARPHAKSHSLLLLGRPNKLKEAGISENQYQTIAEAGVYRLARMQIVPRPNSKPNSKPN